MTLCNDQDLAQYAIRIVLNEKILGDAKRCIQRLGDGLTWDTEKAELKLHFRPRKDYPELINECRNAKVGNLRELFEIVKTVNYQLNELYSFEEIEDRPINYSPENNDRYLVGIVMEKIDNFIRGNVQKDFTLIQIYNRLAELKLLDDERAVSIAHRKIKNFSKNYNRESNRQTNRLDNNHEMHPYRQYNNYNNNRNNNHNFNNNNYNKRNHNNHNNNTVNRNNSSYHRYNNNNSFDRNANINSGRFTTSNRFRNNYNVANGSNNDAIEPMEVDNLQRNFSIRPQNANSP